jgi:molecular chaperone GrpE
MAEFDHKTGPNEANDNPPMEGEQQGDPLAGALNDAWAGAVPATDAKIKDLEAQVADSKDRLLRALAETENVRRRTEREKEDAFKYAVTNFAREMLSVGDNLRRALDSVSAEARDNDPALANLMTGVEMTEREMLSTFEKFGIKPVEALGKRIDPNLHEALFEVEDPSKPAGTVVQVMEKGYTIHDRLLRPARVGVSRGGPKDAPPPAAENDPARASGAGAYERQAESHNFDKKV